ncbi:hypothetical protein F511_47588 [Dorcoceras hygrometricum]|uniref:Uncharacterized protein n=1 Tax=Dorcoceras hygrometricum TaxID=472368 RepID=A0A2Z6ZQN4_9LAMI|nr:hypothetical protein F511_47588 [Dorcoceras hygrometricum]
MASRLLPNLAQPVRLILWAEAGQQVAIAWPSCVITSGRTREVSRVRWGRRTRRRPAASISKIFVFRSAISRLDTIRHSRIDQIREPGSDTTVGIRITPPGEAVEERKIDTGRRSIR